MVREDKNPGKESESFENFILGQDHPCLMAQSVFRQKHVILKAYEELGDAANAPTILQDIENYLRSYDFTASDFFTFIAVFKGRSTYSEKDFEEKLWLQLQDLHEHDTCDWDAEVDSDPESDHFSFSLGGKAFYIIGMHPNSSRFARRSPRPTMVFNLHRQFEELRNMGAFEKTRDTIRERDKKLQGSVNPMLHDFGHNREAPQYSGRQVDESWKCPFHQKNKAQKSGSI